MTNILTTYANGASARTTAKIHNTTYDVVRNLAKAAGIMRTKSEGMYARYRGAASVDDALVLELSWTTIRSPYAPPQWFWGPR